MLAAATAAMQGYGVLYLGPNLPASEIAVAVRASSAGILALSVVGLDRPKAVTELEALVALLPATVDIVVGGPFAVVVAARVGARVLAPGNLGDFERWLAARRKRAASRSVAAGA
jgi:hypothetical protein